MAFSGYDRNHSSHSTSQHTSSTLASNARVKRKPPPAFPYSSRYPHPDPTDPFAPLAVLRERAHSSNTALVSPLEDGSYGPSPIVSPIVGATTGHGHHLYATETQSTDIILHPRVVEHPQAKPRPWRGLASVYHSDSTKPSRPPRSRTRPGAILVLVHVRYDWVS